MKDYNTKGQFLIKSTIEDRFDVNSEPNLQDIMNYNFTDITNPKEYYDECVWKIRETYLKQVLKKQSEMFSSESDTKKRLEIAQEISQTQKKLRNRILED